MSRSHSTPLFIALLSASAGVALNPYPFAERLAPELHSLQATTNFGYLDTSYPSRYSPTQASWLAIQLVTFPSPVPEAESRPDLCASYSPRRLIAIPARLGHTRL